MATVTRRALSLGAIRRSPASGWPVPRGGSSGRWSSAGARRRGSRLRPLAPPLHRPDHLAARTHRRRRRRAHRRPRDAAQDVAVQDGEVLRQRRARRAGRRRAGLCRRVDGRQSVRTRRRLRSRPSTPTGHAVRDTVTLAPFEFVETAEVLSVLLEATVQDATGRFVAGMTDTGFVLAEDGVRQRLDVVRPELLPATYTLLVDSSRRRQAVAPLPRHRRLPLAAPVAAPSGSSATAGHFDQGWDAWREADAGPPEGGRAAARAHRAVAPARLGAGVGRPRRRPSARVYAALHGGLRRLPLAHRPRARPAVRPAATRSASSTTRSWSCCPTTARRRRAARSARSTTPGCGTRCPARWRRRPSGSTRSAGRASTTTTRGAGRWPATRRSVAGSARPTRAAWPIR